MAYDGKIMHRALERFNKDKERRQEEAQVQKEKLYREIPRLREIEQELKGTMAEIINTALRRGADPLPALKTIRDKNMALQEERRALLIVNSYPVDILEEKPFCVLCGDTGYRNGIACTCLQEYYAQEQARELSSLLDMGSASFETFDFQWYSRQQDGHSKSPYEKMKENYDACRDYAARFADHSDNLLLSGEPGLGKTFLSACIAREVSKKGFSVVYDTAAHVFAQFEADRFRWEGEEAAREDVERYLNCDLLIMDDLGTEMLTGFVQSTLYQIVNERLIDGKNTVINTNLSPEELGKRYGAQLRSRLEGEYRVLPFIGKDIRLQKREREIEARQRLPEFWDVPQW